MYKVFISYKDKNWIVEFYVTLELIGLIEEQAPQERGMNTDIQCATQQVHKIQIDLFQIVFSNKRNFTAQEIPIIASFFHTDLCHPCSVTLTLLCAVNVTLTLV